MSKRNFKPEIRSSSVKERISDWCYELQRKIFYPNGMRRKQAIDIRKKRLLFIIGMLLIPAINWIVFWLYVNIQSFVLAFQEPRTGSLTLENFKEVWLFVTMPTNNDLGISLLNTLKYFGTSVFIVMPLCLIVSYFFYKRILGYKVFRVIFYLPAIISSVVMVTAYSEFVSPTGPLGAIQKAFGTTPNPISPLSRKETATTTILIYCILTGMTTNVLLFTSGMSRIPLEVIEAAQLDGIKPVRELCAIIFPMIWPTFSTQMIFALTGLFNSSGPILLFTGGSYNTSTISFWIFQKLYGTTGQGPSIGAYNLVSTLALCCTVIGVPLVLIARKLTEKIDSVEY